MTIDKPLKFGDGTYTSNKNQFIKLVEKVNQSPYTTTYANQVL